MNRALTTVALAPRQLCRGLIVFYQWVISPLFPGCCRFSPSCSHYAAEAIDRHGAVRGCWLAVRRIFRCHPWGGSGFDPVPVHRSGNEDI